MAMTTVEERLSRLEGVYDHLASKADVAKVETQIADLRAELKGDIAGLRTELKGDIAKVETQSAGGVEGRHRRVADGVSGCGRRCTGSTPVPSSGSLALWQASWSWA
jgi:hypothetical protein